MAEEVQLPLRIKLAWPGEPERSTKAASATYKTIAFVRASGVR
jgi:hypothetical protein